MLYMGSNVRPVLVLTPLQNGVTIILLDEPQGPTLF